jgi:hypothetical protein
LNKANLQARVLTIERRQSQELARFPSLFFDKAWFGIPLLAS